MITRLKEGVYWVGATDWEIREFHGHEYSTDRGTSYNAYLIRDKKNVLIDTVAAPFAGKLLDNIGEVMDPSELDYIVVNHSEPDHAGALPEIVEHAPNAEIIISKRGEDAFRGHHHRDWEVKGVSTGEEVDAGECRLVFVEAPMLHWPDSMFTLDYEALKYYANILTPFSPLVKKKIAEFKELDLPVDMIAPSHGVIWRNDPMQIVEEYDKWADQKPERRALVLYDTMWNATRLMAESIGEGLAEEGIDHRVFHAAVTDRNDILVEVFRSRVIIIGSSTLNNGLLPTITPILEDLKGLKFKNKLGAAFGSYGWSGESVGIIRDHFKNCKIELIEDGLKCKWRPDGKKLRDCRDFGRKIGKVLAGESL